MNSIEDAALQPPQGGSCGPAPGMQDCWWKRFKGNRNHEGAGARL